MKNTGKPKYIRTLAHLNLIFKMNVMSESVRADISQRILDWLENPNNSVKDDYIVNQLIYAERICESADVDLANIFG